MAGTIDERGGAVTEMRSDPHDREEMRAEVLAGLRRADRRLPSKYHYDARGSELFDEITRLEEYYPTRTERALLARVMPEWVRATRPRALVELGAGSAEKTRLVLDAMVAERDEVLYVPVDVSGDFLQGVADGLRRSYPTLRVEPAVADITKDLELPRSIPGPAWIAFLGSTLGNFDPEGATRLLRRVSTRMERDDRFVLGVDLRPGPRKPVSRIERAYNDAAGVTEAFSKNLLVALNESLGCDFDPGGFRYQATYVEAHGRIETHLVATRSQVVTFPDGAEVRFAEGEAVRTEISAKYDRATVDALFDSAGLRVERWVEDPEGLYAIVSGVLAAP